MIFLYILIGIIFGGLIITLMNQPKISKLITRNEIAKEELETNKELLNSEREKIISYNSENSRLATINSNLQEKLENHKRETEELQSKFTDSFKNLANDILEEKTKKFTEQNKTNLDEILIPLREKIKDFEHKVENTNEKNRQNNVSLIQQIKDLKELNQKISNDATNLTKALKGDVKIQGNWGEVILERILEESGLRKGIEYDAQVSLINDEGHRQQPDVIINLPENKHLIVDAKVSLVHYERMISSESEEQSKGYLKALNSSVKTQIDDLHKKHYQNLKGLNSPDFVMLFIPIEGVFAVIMQLDNTLYQYAYNKQIVIVSPSTLLATLRTIAFIWRQENQTKNALEIARQSGALLDKFNGFLEDLEKIDLNLDRTKRAYDSAINKLAVGKGNLLNRVKSIEELRGKGKKPISSNFSNLGELE